jgi:hypothetical protein
MFVDPNCDVRSALGCCKLRRRLGRDTVLMEIPDKNNEDGWRVQLACENMDSKNIEGLDDARNYIGCPSVQVISKETVSLPMPLALTLLTR